MKKKGLLPVILAIAMVITMLPASVFAGENVAKIGSDEYATVQSAVDAIEESEDKSGTITLINNSVEDVTITNGNVVLDLNGKTLTNNAGDTISVKINASLTVVGDGLIDNKSNGKAAVFNEGTVDLNGGTYDRTSESGQSADISGGNSWYTICNHGSMTIREGVVVKNTGSFSSMIENGYYNYTSEDPRTGYVSETNHESPQLTIYGGEFIGGLNTVKNDDGASLIIKGGTYKNTTQAAILNWNITEISGGEFVCESENCVLNGASAASPSDKDLGKLTITGGIFDSSGSAVVNNFNTNEDVNITGGEYTSDVSEYLKGDCAVLVYPAPDDEAGYEHLFSVVADENMALWLGATYKVSKGEDTYYYQHESDIVNGDGEAEKIGNHVFLYGIDPDGKEIADHSDYLSVPLGESVNGFLESIGLEILDPDPIKGYEYLGWYEPADNGWRWSDDGSVVIGLNFSETKYDFDSEVTGDTVLFTAWEKQTAVGETNDGETDTVIEKTEKSPQTGDESNMTVPFAMAGLALAVMAAVVATRKRHN